MYVFSLLRRSNPDVEIKRIGMRYINNIDFTRVGKTNRIKRIRSTLIESVYDKALENASMIRTQHLTEIKVNDFRVRCVTGLFNPDYPAIIKKSIVTLDFDAFIEGHIHISGIEDYLDKFHNSIETLFEASILQLQRNEMGIVSEQ